MKKTGLFGMGLLICFLITFTGGSALSFVTPEHYEKIKQEARAREKNDEKSTQQSPEVPGRIQVHSPPTTNSTPAGPTKK
jgi:hypothetical protein